MIKFQLTIVGVGGIGSALFQDIARMYGEKISIKLIDGDRVEGKNVTRQHFSLHHLGMNKAEALSASANAALGLRVNYLDEYIPTNDFSKAAHCLTCAEPLIIVGCVDNHPTRSMLEKCAEYLSKNVLGSSVYYIDCANELKSGEVVCTYASKSKVGVYRSAYDSRVHTDLSNSPNGCSSNIQEGRSQTLFTNRKAAIIALELIDLITKGKFPEGIVYFDSCKIERILCK